MNIEIRPLLTTDAAQLVSCFERCYGRTYANETFYDPAAIARLVETGVLKSVVALSGDGRIVGHTGLNLGHPDARVTEAGNTVVDPDARGEGILGRMGEALASLCRESGFAGYVHYPTTAHEVMQKRSVANGGIETGVMLGYVPAETEYLEIDRSAGRIAATIVYQPFLPAPGADVIVPERYAPLLGRLYGEMGLRRSRVPAPAAVPDRDPTQAPFTVHARRSLLSIRLQHIGEDVAATIDRIMCDKSTDITHADLTLDQPDIDLAVDSLVKLGFFYCGLLPGFAQSDVLRMQHLRDQPPAVFAPSLSNPGARTLLAMIDLDRRA